MLKKIVSLSRIEIEAGHVGVRFDKKIVDGDVAQFSEPHRTVIPRGVNPTEQLNLVDAHLAQLGYPPISKDDRARIVSFVNLAHA